MTVWRGTALESKYGSIRLVTACGRKGRTASTNPWAVWDEIDISPEKGRRQSPNTGRHRQDRGRFLDNLLRHRRQPAQRCRIVGRIAGDALLANAPRWTDGEYKSHEQPVTLIRSCTCIRRCSSAWHYRWAHLRVKEKEPAKTPSIVGEWTGEKAVVGGMELPVPKGGISMTFTDDGKLIIREGKRKITRPAPIRLMQKRIRPRLT